MFKITWLQKKIHAHHYIQEILYTIPIYFNCKFTTKKSALIINYWWEGKDNARATLAGSGVGGPRDLQESPLAPILLIWGCFLVIHCIFLIKNLEKLKNVNFKKWRKKMTKNKFQWNSIFSAPRAPIKLISCQNWSSYSALCASSSCSSVRGPDFNW